ncbi:MAG: class I SAM-dependent methyltransferase [Angelakisella sp.]
MAGYNASFAAFYDSLIGEVDYAARADFFLKQVSCFKDRCELVLDLACGTGSLSVELAARGLEVIGVDASPDMLMQATAKPVGEGCRPILFLCQPMEQLDLYGTVDAAFCMQDSLNHLEGEGAVQQAFDRLKFFVEPGGIFIFDLNTPYKHRAVLGNNTFVYDTDQVYCVWQNFYHATGGAVDIELDFFERRGTSYHRSSESFREYSFDTPQVERMLLSAGFALLEVQGDYTGLPPCDKEERLVYIAKRKE